MEPASPCVETVASSAVVTTTMLHAAFLRHACARPDVPRKIVSEMVLLRRRALTTLRLSASQAALEAVQTCKDTHVSDSSQSPAKPLNKEASCPLEELFFSSKHVRPATKSIQFYCTEDERFCSGFIACRQISQSRFRPRYIY